MLMLLPELIAGSCCSAATAATAAAAAATLLLLLPKTIAAVQLVLQLLETIAGSCCCPSYAAVSPDQPSSSQTLPPYPIGGHQGGANYAPELNHRQSESRLLANQAAVKHFRRTP